MGLGWDVWSCRMWERWSGGYPPVPEALPVLSERQLSQHTHQIRKDMLLHSMLQ
jgi:hypothetical protein